MAVFAAIVTVAAGAAVPALPALLNRPVAWAVVAALDLVTVGVTIGILGAPGAVSHHRPRSGLDPPGLALAAATGLLAGWVAQSGWPPPREAGAVPADALPDGTEAAVFVGECCPSPCWRASSEPSGAGGGSSRRCSARWRCGWRGGP